MEIRYTPRDYAHNGPATMHSDNSFTRLKSVRTSPPSLSSSFTSPIAMSIPGMNSHDEPPPPLPPPRFVPVDGPSVCDSSFVGQPAEASPEDREARESYRPRDHAYDEGYHSIGSSRTFNAPRFSMHNSYHARPNSYDCDSNMLNKLNSRRTIDNRSPTALPASPSARTRLPRLSSSARDPTANRPPPMQLPKLLSLPDRSRHQQPILEFPQRYHHSPLGSAVSPHNSNYYPPGQGLGGSSLGDHRSPLSTEITDFGGSSFPTAWRMNTGSVREEALPVGIQGQGQPGPARQRRGRHDTRDDEPDFPMDDASPMGLLTIEDRDPRDRRQKRRASSPPEESTIPGASDMFRRRDISRLTRGSPVPRLHPIPQSSLSLTFSSLSSGGRSATSATTYTSGSSMTSIGSFGRRSPVGPSSVSPLDTEGSPGIQQRASPARVSSTGRQSPGSSQYHKERPIDGDDRQRLGQPYNGARIHHHQNTMVPQQDQEGPGAPHWPPQAASGLGAPYPLAQTVPPSSGAGISSQAVHMAASVGSVDDISRRSSAASWHGSVHQQQQQHAMGRRDSNMPSIQNQGEPLESSSSGIAAKMQGFLMCECCPKKPKRFETREALSAHESEKQYQCSYCPNRFKNKNEAERHQNSLHLRRNSWSCSAMTSFERAFHESTVRPGEADSCGYCGQDFPRTGEFIGNQGRRTITADWDMRAQHLQDVHKFRECNVTKKFWRADHFRQHLKHSHAGSSGKWTNLLESACMIDEEPTALSPR